MHTASEESDGLDGAAELNASCQSFPTMTEVTAEKNYELVAVEHVPDRTTKPDIAWVNLNYHVGQKAILSECWGHVEAGSVCAIMGPSGAGKSSLLNVLAGRSAPAAGVSIQGRVSSVVPALTI